MMTPNPRRFFLQRNEDETGNSGTGLVAEGIEFSNGRCVVSWLTATSTIGVYDAMKEVEALHGHGGKTIVVWKD